MIKKGALFLFLILLNSCSFFKPPPVYDSVSLGAYQPFADKTKAVRLKEESTLKLTDNLPILDGATALYPLYAAFVQAVYPEGEYSGNGTWSEDYATPIHPTVASSRTADAYDYLIDGTVDIIFCAKPSDYHIQKAADNGMTFEMTPIGKEAFVFFVNRNNSASNLTTEQIRGIYSGRITDWSELGWKKKPIKVYQRGANSGSQTMLESIMGDEEIIEPLTEDVLTLMLDMVTEVSAYRNYTNAIGYSFLFYMTELIKTKEIKLLGINGVYPSEETIRTNEYPYSDVFYAITTNTQNENAGKFIEWILSDQGQSLVKETGYVPIK
jgi:phosphate transport system substrate-binding protein